MTGRDTLGRDVGGYVDPPWIAAMRAEADRLHLAKASGATHTLGQLIDLLEPFASGPVDLPVEFRGCGLDGRAPVALDSWRGSYADLALEPGDEPWTARDLLEKLRDADGEEFEGCKGGTFTMDRDTPVWVDAWGDYTYPERGITAVRPLVRNGQPAAVLLVLREKTS